MIPIAVGLGFCASSFSRELGGKMAHRLWAAAAVISLQAAAVCTMVFVFTPVEMLRNTHYSEPAGVAVSQTSLDMGMDSSDACSGVDNWRRDIGVRLSLREPNSAPERRCCMKSKQNLTCRFLILYFASFSASALAQEAAPAPSADDRVSVIGCLRTINTAELTYGKAYNNGFSPNLKALSVPDQGPNYTASAAGLIDASLGGSKRNRYVFTYKAGAPDAHGKISSYAGNASPIKWQTGVQNFFTDQTGVLRSTTENRPATAKDPDIDK